MCDLLIPCIFVTTYAIFKCILCWRPRRRKSKECGRTRILREHLLVTHVGETSRLHWRNVRIASSGCRDVEHMTAIDGGSMVWWMLHVHVLFLFLELCLVSGLCSEGVFIRRCHSWCKCDMCEFNQKSGVNSCIWHRLWNRFEITLKPVRT